MKIASVLPLLLAGLTHAAVIGVPQDANVPENGLAIEAVPTPYKDLAFRGLSVGAAAPISVAALRPSSLQNFAVHLSLSPAVDITTVFPGSKTTAFDLKSTNAGCYAPTQNGFVAPALNCTITFTGTKAANGQKVTSNFKFTVPSPLGIGLVDQPVAPFVFPNSFTQLRDVAVAVTAAVIPNIDGATVQYALDDVRYIAYLSN